MLVFYQQAHLSFLCLQSLLEYADVSYELSSLTTTQQMRRLTCSSYRWSKRHSQHREPGLREGRKPSSEAATGEYILLLNNDALIERDSLTNALAVIDGDDSVGAVGAKIKLLDGSTQEAGSIIWNDGACLGYGRGKSPQSYEFMYQRDVDYCSGAFLLFRRSSFEALDGFDLDYAPAYYEESDFCIRFRNRASVLSTCQLTDNSL